MAADDLKPKKPRALRASNVAFPKESYPEGRRPVSLPHDSDHHDVNDHDVVARNTSGGREPIVDDTSWQDKRFDDPSFGKGVQHHNAPGDDWLSKALAEGGEFHEHTGHHVKDDVASANSSPASHNDHIEHASDADHGHDHVSFERMSSSRSSSRSQFNKPNKPERGRWSQNELEVRAVNEHRERDL